MKLALDGIVFSDGSIIYNGDEDSWEEQRRKLDARRERVFGRLRKEVHRAARAVGVYRFAVSKTGRRYLMFNAGEAEAVYGWLLKRKQEIGLRVSRGVPKHHKWEWRDNLWELVEVEKPVAIPREQLALPLEGAR